MREKKILFFSTPIGSGHMRAAQAVCHAMEHKMPNVRTNIQSIFDFLPYGLGKSILNSYLLLLSVYPQAYGMMYGWGNSSRLTLFFRSMINRYLAGRMLSTISAFKPSLIVCTHATPAGIAAYLLQQRKIDIPVAGIITDFTVHRWWIYPELSCYFGANDDIYNKLVQHQIPSSHIQIQGIPVDPVFSVKREQGCVRRQFGLAQDIPVILVMGGGAGMLPMDKIAAVCSSLDMPVQILAVAGRNKTMYRRLRMAHRPETVSLHVFPFTDKVPDLMAAADLLISKPGGMTCAEAMCMSLPMLVYQPIPGQEEANTAYLEQHHAAVRVNTLPEMKENLHSLLQGRDSLQKMRGSAAALGQPWAAEHIAQKISEWI